MLIVVRHADAGQRSAWPGPDLARPLSALGHLQADGLVVRLEDFPIDRILSGRSMRCLQSAQPLARERRLRVQTVSALDVEARPAGILALWSRLPFTMAMCTHGESIGRLLAELADELVTDSLLQWPKGSSWLLQRVSPRRVRARYFAPLAIDCSGRPVGGRR